MIPARPRIPVMVLTGFLGAGKTTLLNALIGRPELADTAVVINELGDVALDHLLVRKVDDRVMVIGGGCVCCTVLGDLVETLTDLDRRRDAGEVPPFARVMVETTGLADPGPVLGTLTGDDRLFARFELDGVVTVVDATHGAGQLEEHYEALQQAVAADHFVVTKAELAGEAVTQALVATLAALNPAATVDVASHGAVDPARLRGRLAADLPTARVRGLIAASPGEKGRWLVGDAPRHARVRSLAIVRPRTMRWTAFAMWLSLLTQFHGERLLRCKALLKVAGETGPVIVHAVQHVVYPSVILDAWPDADETCRAVLIFRDVDDAFLRQVQEGFDACLAPVG
ncbi:MAG: cobalamin synthesis protein [Myxococcaceae bacterium]|nr:cobalamin synthesis protein [Myxococcaceae bacterium]